MSWLTNLFGISDKPAPLDIDLRSAPAVVRIKVEYCIAAAMHDGSYEAVIEVPRKVALRLRAGERAVYWWSSSDDTAGNLLLKSILSESDPHHCYMVSRVVSVGLTEDPITHHTPGVRACGSNECVAGQRDGVLCANGECDRENGVRPDGVSASPPPVPPSEKT